MYKLISWNVNGLRAVCGKGFADIFTELDADFFCLQETKMQAGQLDLEFPGYTSYWNYADKKGYSGTAIYTKHEPIAVTYGIGIDEHDHEGRVITMEMEDFFLVCVYTPNSQDELRRLDYRMQWEDDFKAYLKGLEEGLNLDSGKSESKLIKGILEAFDEIVNAIDQNAADLKEMTDRVDEIDMDLGDLEAILFEGFEVEELTEDEFDELGADEDEAFEVYTTDEAPAEEAAE